ncbi:pyruvate carboxyl transferase [Algibacter lectus]|uniref:Pyruvate carboxyl transferase n=1 Tax=Algibacter lectus TaxID=221126 RepID=A0A090WX90_9FLAO|nr:pyruvate carboxyl transferase [Algibacter lectus]
MKIKKILVANRGEIAIRIFRACTEISIKTVGIYTFEDRYSLHRYKADESYQIGEDNEPLKPYLNIDAIIKIALKNGPMPYILAMVFYLKMLISLKLVKITALFLLVRKFLF